MKTSPKLYGVTFEIHRDCQIRNLIFHTWANNAREACEIARQQFPEKTHSGSHMFHVHAYQSKLQDPEKLHVVNWKGQSITGQDVLQNFYCVDFRTWRVNGRSVYA